MKYVGFILAVFFVSISYCQTGFDRSEKRFNKYLMSDSVKAKGELEYQRTHIRSHQEKVRYHLNLAVYYNHKNQSELAKTYLDKVEQELLPDEIEQEGELFRIRSSMLYRTSRFEEANAVIDEFFKKHEKIPTKLRIKLLIYRSEINIALGKYEQAKKNALICYGILQKKTPVLSDELKISILTSMYNVCYYQAKYDSALYYLYQAEPLYKDGTVLKAGFYDRIAIVYTVMEQFPKAIVYHGKSVAILEKLNAPLVLAHTLYNLSVCTKGIDPEKSIPIFERTLKVAREAKYDHVIGYSLQELGDLYLTKKDYARAEKYNREALEVFKNTGVEHGMAHTLLNIGRQHLETGNFDEALKYLQEVLVLAKKIDDIVLFEHCYEYLYGLYERMGNYRMAFYYHKLYAQTQRKILKLDMQSNIEELNISYEVRMQKATNNLLQKEVKLKNKKISAERNVKWLLGVLLFMLLVAGWFLRRLLMQRTRLKEIELQLVQSELKGMENEKELTVQELDIVKQQMISKNALIGELNKLLLENEQNLISKEQFGNLVTNDNDWVQFLAKLQLLYPQFADNLKSKYPNLSKNEFRLAALVRLNLSDKEISELLIIELSSVKKAKNRLKQKLGLDANEKLDSYLGNL